MTQTNIDTQSAGQIVTLLTITQGSTTYRYAGADEDVTVGVDTYTAEPALTVDLGDQHGSAEDEPAEVTLPWTLGPLPSIQSGDPQPQTTATIAEALVNDPAGTDRLVWSGRVHSVKPAEGRPGLAKLTIAGHKRLLATPAGVPAGPQCQWVFGGRGCGLNVDALETADTIVSVSGAVVTLTKGQATPRLRHGSLRVGDLSIPIRSHDSATQVTLRSEPPASWTGSVSVTCRPGCDRTQTTCDSVWANLIQFGGIGVRMPDRDVNFERG